MITDADVKKLKAVFATKDDLIAMEKRQDTKFATKDDLDALSKQMAKQSDLQELAKVSAKQSDLLDVKKDILRLETKVDSVSEDVQDLTSAVGAIFQWTDDIHSAITGKKSSRVLSEN